jgi:UDP-N-acetylglucosamine transferase subunit ALG13
MIFVTVGSMMPFDRLIRAADAWAREYAEQEVVAQIGGGSYLPNHMRWQRMLLPSEFRRAVQDACVLVAHAGMGSFFVAMEIGKPIVLVPRFAAKGEHTTDHQVHTVQWLRQKPGVYVAMSDDDLADAINRALVERNRVDDSFCTVAPQPFLSKVRQFLLT